MPLDVTLPAEPLRRALERVAKVVERRNTIPILSNALVRCEMDGSIAVTGTDLDAWATATLPQGSATVAQAGATTLPAQLLLDILKRAAGDVRIACDERQAKVATGRSRFTLHVLPVEDFPDAPDSPDGGHFDLTSDQLTRITDACAFAISTEETRYYLNGVLLHAHDETGLVAVATDGHRLSRLSLPNVEIDGTLPRIIVPRKTVQQFTGVAAGCDSDESVAVAADERRISFQTRDFRLLSKLIDGAFPDYQRVIPSGNEKRVTLERKVLAAATDRVGSISSERGRATRFAFDGAGSVELGCRSPDHGEATDVIDANGQFEQIEIGFNGRYLGDILGSFGCERIEIALADPGSPAVITDPGDATRLVVLMPMRV